MTRPSRNLDRKMIEAGKKIIIKEGSDGLTVRNICKVAKVNLGMFNYYFKDKDNYIRIVYGAIKNKVDRFIEFDKVKDKSSIEQLRYVFVKLGEFTIKETKLVSSMFLDGIIKGRAFQDFVEKKVIQRDDSLMALIKKAKDDGYLKTSLPPFDIFSMLILGGINPIRHEESKKAFKEYLDPEGQRKSEIDYLKERINVILKGLESY